MTIVLGIDLDQPPAPPAPEKIYGWLDTQLSVARHYGGMRYQGHDYRIDFNDAERPLVRIDIWRKELKAARQEQASDSYTRDLFG
jgi:hypothetical protein